MENEIFNYPDTNSSRAEIEYLNRKFSGQKIAIIGLGGTGSYILDMLAKTPVAEIHLYDSDLFQLHNAFRAPGAISTEEFDVDGGLYKVDYYSKIYSRMRRGIVAHRKNITEENIDVLNGFSFVFIGVDKNKARYMITKALSAMGIRFIDTGLGVTKSGETLLGTIRVTTATGNKMDHLAYKIGEMEMDGNMYATNIQIAELNALNAILAVIKWKKLIGFYQDLKEEHNMLYFINTNKLLNNDFPA
jgi:hypothetical protein